MIGVVTQNLHRSKEPKKIIQRSVQLYFICDRWQYQFSSTVVVLNKLGTSAVCVYFQSKSLLCSSSACKFILFKLYIAQSLFSIYFNTASNLFLLLNHPVLFFHLRSFTVSIEVFTEIGNLIECLGNLFEFDLISELTPEQQKLLIELRRKKQELLLEIQVSGRFFKCLLQPSTIASGTLESVI